MNNIKQQQTHDLIHREFEYYAKERPDAIAIKYSQQQLTYAQLNGQANHLAQLLIKRGCQPGDTVPLMMDRSPKMIAAILAILKMGCAY
jgi:non-ribosomal peptide synthetase component F